MSAAREIEGHAARWLLRQEEPDWSEQDQRELDEWLTESDAHKAAYWRLEYGWRAADRISAIGAAAPARAWRNAVRAHWWKPVAAAASLLLVLGVLAFQTSGFRFGQGPEIQTSRFQTPLGGRRQIRLADGSRIELNTSTAIRAQVDRDRRTIWLDHGEAYFDVVRNEQRPFVVHAGPRTITVLGTRFSVRRTGARVTVAVAEGRVRVEDSASSAAAGSTTITAGDLAIADGATTLVASDSETRVQEQLAWRDGLLMFDSMTLSNAASEFNRYNRRQIVITDPAIANIRIGGRFQAHNVDAFARLLREAYGFRVDIGGDEITVSN